MPTWVTIVVAFVAIVSYLTMVLLLYFNRDLKDPDWSRVVSLFTGIQAVGFSAFGWAIGTQVGQGAVNVAREQVNMARQQVETKQEALTQAVSERTALDLKAAQALEKGQQLARYIRERPAAVAEGQAEGVILPPGVPDETTLLAKALFPEVFE